MREIVARRIAGTPPLTSTERMVACNVDAAGRPVVLATERPDLAVARVVAPNGVAFPATRPAEPCPAAVYVHDGGWQRIPIVRLPAANGSIELLPDDEILLVGSRCAAYGDGTFDDNAFVYGLDGSCRAAFCLGDGISQLAADRAGTVWTAYFDEGVFGNYGWGGDGAPKPLGAAGLVRWSARGERLWKFRATGAVESIIDCSQINVADEAVWISYYAFHHLVEIRDGEVGEAWPLARQGVRAMAPVDRSVLIVSGDEALWFDRTATDARERLRAISTAGTSEDYQRARDDLVAEHPGERCLLRRPDGSDLAGEPVRCRGSRIFFLDDDGFSSIDATEQRPAT